MPCSAYNPLTGLDVLLDPLDLILVLDGKQTFYVAQVFQFVADFGQVGFVNAGFVLDISLPDSFCAGFIDV